MILKKKLTLTLDGTIQPLSYQSGVAQVVANTVVGTISTSGNAKVTVTSPLVAGSPLDTSVAVVAGTPQVETATVAGTIGASGAGNATVIVTAAGMTGSPKTISVAVANNDTASQVAGKIRTALGLDSAVIALFAVSGATDKVILTKLSPAANDATLNIDIDNGTCSGLTPAPTSANTTAGVATDDASSVAAKIVTALNGVGAISTYFTASAVGASLRLTAVSAAAQDNTLRVEVQNDTCVGLSDTFSQTTTTGVAAGGAGIATGKFTVSNPATNSHDIYLGHAVLGGGAPPALDSSANLFVIPVGGSVDVGETTKAYWVGEKYVLSRWFVKGTNAETCQIDYVHTRLDADFKS